MNFACASLTRLALIAAMTSSAELFAAETEGRNVPVTRTPESDAISSSRREFETINSARDPNLQQKGAVPRLSAPEMPVTSGTGWSPAKAKTPEKKSNNWLLDAMEKPADDRKRAGRGKGDRELDRTRDAFGLSTEEGVSGEVNRRTESQATDARDNERKTTDTPIANPLNHYLGDWMTSQDYSLLKPGLTESALAGAGGRDSGLLPALQMPGGKLLPGMESTPGLMSTPTTVLAPSSAPKPNPYLESLNAPTVRNAAPVYAPPPAATPNSLKPIISAVPPAPPVIEPAKPKVPDFAKPAQDEKYFKQLKRF